MKELMIRNFKESQYSVLFDKNSGRLVRVGQTEHEPFCNIKTPELLDIAITNYCERGCDFCYRLSNKNGRHMELLEYTRLVKEASKLGVMQIALGGGNPNQHPDFVSILEITRKHLIIPSYTTNGQGMTDEIYRATKEYCGALAVSWYSPYIDAMNVINECNNRSIRVNIHFMINKETINDAIALMRDNALLEKVNAVIFLAYKPIHSTFDLCLEDDVYLGEFLNEVQDSKPCKIGFDSCMISYLTKLEESVKSETVDYCEAARFSAFISEESVMYPCSFMCDTSIQGIDLKRTSIQEAWKNGEIFSRIRLCLSNPSMQLHPIIKCKGCNKYDFCHGGCQVFNINMCRST